MIETVFILIYWLSNLVITVAHLIIVVIAIIVFKIVILIEGKHGRLALPWMHL